MTISLTINRMLQVRGLFRNSQLALFFIFVLLKYDKELRLVTAATLVLIH